MCGVVVFDDGGGVVYCHDRDFVKDGNVCIFSILILLKLIRLIVFACLKSCLAGFFRSSLCFQ